MELIGHVVRLQVQRGRLKPGPRGARVYDPSPQLEVPELEVGPPRGRGQAHRQRAVDVHHADHPDTRWAGPQSALSLLPRAAYPHLRAHYGEHLADGVAGESLLVELRGPWPDGDLLLESSTGPLALAAVVPATPCVEFARFCLRLPVDVLDDRVRQALVDLDDGARGYLAQPQGTGTVVPGARLWAA